MRRSGFVVALAMVNLTALDAQAALSAGPCPEAEAAQDDIKTMRAVVACIKRGERNPAWLSKQVERVGLIALRSDGLTQAELLYKAIESKGVEPETKAALAQWRAALSDVKRYGAKNAERVPADKLYDDATEQFLRGFKMHKEGLEDEALPELQAAAGLLLPFIMRNGEDPRVAHALLMMGVIKRSSWLPGDDQAALAYLQAAINKAPNSRISENAWRYLGEQLQEMAETSKSGRLSSALSPALLRLKPRVRAD